MDNPALAIVLWILGQSATISLVVNALKGNPWVRAHPKFTSLLLNLLAGTVETFYPNVVPGGALTVFFGTVAAQFAASGFYENVIKPGITIVMPPGSMPSGTTQR